MVSQIANPHHGDLELVRGNESSICAINLTKELRNDKELASTYLLSPQLEENQIENLPDPHPPFLFSDLGELLFRANNGGPEEEEGAQIPLQYIFCCICHCIIYSVCGKGVMVSPLDKKIVKLKQQKRFYWLCTNAD